MGCMFSFGRARGGEPGPGPVPAVVKGEKSQAVVDAWAELRRDVTPEEEHLKQKPEYHGLFMDKMVRGESLCGLIAYGSNNRTGKLLDVYFITKTNDELASIGTKRPGGWPEHFTGHLKLATILRETLADKQYMSETDKFSFCIGLSADDSIGFKFSSCANQELRLHGTPDERGLPGRQEELLLGWLTKLMPDIAKVTIANKVCGNAIEDDEE